MKGKTGLLMITLLAGGAQAEQIYQCGNSFQDTPCKQETKQQQKVIGKFERQNESPEELQAYQEKMKLEREKTLAEADARYQSEVEAATKARKNSYNFSKGITAAAKHQVTTGQSKDQVIQAWGRPDKINDSYHDGGTANEQWVYRVSDFESRYIYFEDGKVVGWN